MDEFKISFGAVIEDSVVWRIIEAAALLSIKLMDEDEPAILTGVI